MKTLLYLTLVLLTGGCAFAQPETTGAQWNVILKVVDENDRPVAGANASVGYISKPLPGQVVEDSRDLSKEISGLTDQDGIFTATHTDTSWSLGFDVQKTGYYPTRLTHDLYLPGQFDPDTVAKNRNPTITIVLKKILDPIPMYAKRIRDNPPVLNRPIGYDLEVGDWVAPYGKGKVADIVFERDYNEQSPRDYHSKITVSFPNLSDGIQANNNPFKIKEGSALKSLYNAPENGYQQQLVRVIDSHSRQFDYNENRASSAEFVG
ncbi:MAG: hypothetical protein ACREDS_01495 [Limisphaerales bacterium]